jgi:hypothetical protein
VDSKPHRDYLGEKAVRDMALFTDAVMSELRRAIPDESVARQAIGSVQALSSQIAWLGGPGDFDVSETLAKILGHLLWETMSEPRRLSQVRIEVRDGDLDAAARAILPHAQDIVDRKVFIVWELSGFSSPGHIVDMMVDHPKLESIGYVLFRYKWQTMLHADRATDAAKSVLQDLSDLVTGYLGISEDSTGRRAMREQA